MFVVCTTWLYTSRGLEHAGRKDCVLHPGNSDGCANQFAPANRAFLLWQGFAIMCMRGEEGGAGGAFEIGTSTVKHMLMLTAQFSKPQIRGSRSLPSVTSSPKPKHRNPTQNLQDPICPPGTSHGPALIRRTTTATCLHWRTSFWRSNGPGFLILTTGFLGVLGNHFRERATCFLPFQDLSRGSVVPIRMQL